MKRNFDLKKWIEENEVTEDSLRKLVAKMVHKEYQDIIRIRDAQIEKNGINDWHLRHMDPTELISLNGTFKMMLDYFEENDFCLRSFKINKNYDKD